MKISLYQKYLRTIKWFLWRPIDFDWVYANQCVDWVKAYAVSLWYRIGTKWNAKDFANLWLGKNWTIVYWEPWVWDIVVFPSWEYGHIAVVVNISKWYVNVVDQNANWQANKNNNSKNLWSVVSNNRYKLEGNEVFFRVNA